MCFQPGPAPAFRPAPLDARQTFTPIHQEPALMGRYEPPPHLDYTFAGIEGKPRWSNDPALKDPLFRPSAVDFAPPALEMIKPITPAVSTFSFPGPNDDIMKPPRDSLLTPEWEKLVDCGPKFDTKQWIRDALKRCDLSFLED
jgi:hypothetical protein